MSLLYCSVALILGCVYGTAFSLPFCLLQLVPAVPAPCSCCSAADVLLLLPLPSLQPTLVRGL